MLLPGAFGLEYCDLDSDCDDWEECLYGTCHLEHGACITKYDCDFGEECDASTHLCTLREGYCRTSADCEDWEECPSSVCRLKRGACVVDSDCDYDEYCEADIHTCREPGFCAKNSDCREWEECVEKKCELTSGRCETGSDCTDGETCDFATHSCATGEECGGGCGSAVECPSQDSGYSGAAEESGSGGGLCGAAFILLATSLLAVKEGIVEGVPERRCAQVFKAGMRERI